MQIMGANPAAKPVGKDPLPGKVNYIIGRDPAQWHTDIPTFGRVEYQNVYSGINLAYYGGAGGLEYDFIVNPGADPGAIALKFDGADVEDGRDHGSRLAREPSRPLEETRQSAHAGRS